MLTVGPLPLAMSPLSRLADLIALACRTNLLTPLAASALFAAIALASVATGADGKYRPAVQLHAPARSKTFDMIVCRKHDLNIHGFRRDQSKKSHLRRGTMMGASGAMMLSPPAQSSENYVFR